LTSATRETLDELSVSDVFAQRLSSESLEPEVQARLVGLYQQVVAELAEESA
jgi:exonuclease SbcD